MSKTNGMVETQELAAVEQGVQALSIDYKAVTMPKQRLARLFQANLKDTGKLNLYKLKIVVPSGSGPAAWAVGDEPVKSLQGVITNWFERRAFYRYSKDEAKKHGVESGVPDCYSRDAIKGSKTAQEIYELASEALADTQVNVYEPAEHLANEPQKCKGCPFAQFGTRGKGQACKLSVQAYLLSKDAVLPRPVNIPVTSVGNFKEYAQGLLVDGVPVYGIETALTLEKQQPQGSDAYYKVKFTRAGKPFGDNETDALDAYAADLEQYIDPADDLLEGDEAA